MDPYRVLGVAATADDEVIRAAYRVRIRQSHPDAGGDAAEAQRVNEAYAILSDPAKRAAYDASTSTEAVHDAGTAAPPPVAEERIRAQAYRGEVDPPRPYWAWLPVVVTAGALLVLSIVMVVTAFVHAAPLGAVVPVVFAGVAWLGHHRRWGWAAVAFVVGVFAAATVPATWWVGVLAPMAFVTAIVLLGLLRISLRVERRGWEVYHADVVLTTAEATGLAMYQVERVARRDHWWDVRLRRLVDGAIVTTGILDEVHERDYVVLDGSRVLARANAVGMTRALRLR